MISTILLVFAFVFFVCGVVAPGAPSGTWYGRFSFMSAGLACWMLSLLLRG